VSARLIRRSLLTPFLAVATALLVAAVFPGSVAAHGEPVDCVGEGAVFDDAPSELRICFSERIEGEFSTLQAEDENREPVQLLEVHTDLDDDTALVGTLPELPSGIYTVAWKVLSKDDGHVTQGTTAFRVGGGPPVTTTTATETSDSVPLMEILLRWLNWGLTAMVAGSLFVFHLVLKPRAEEPGAQALLGQAQRRALRFAVLAGCTGLVVGVALLLLKAAAIADGSVARGLSDGTWWRVLSETRYGALWLAREGALLALTVVVLLLARKWRPATVAAAVLVPVLATAQALNSHAAALADDEGFAVAADALHILAASIWIGGLLALVVALLPIMRLGPDRRALAGAVWRRFGPVAAVSLGVLAVTGLYSTGRQVASLDALLTTLYGQALMAKVALALGAGCMGLLSALLIRPHLAAPLARLLRHPAGWAPFGRRRLAALVVAEAGLGILILLAVGLITAIAPARGPEFRPPAPSTAPSFLSQPVDDLVLTLSARPNKPGKNLLTIDVLDTRRPSLAPVLGVSARFTYLDRDLGSTSVEAVQDGPGRYRLVGDDLGAAGSWRVDVVARRQGLPDSIASFDWTVPALAPETPSRAVLISNRPLRAPLTTAAVMSGILLMMMTASTWAARRLPLRPPAEETRDLEPRPGAWKGAA